MKTEKKKIKKKSRSRGVRFELEDGSSKEKKETFSGSRRSDRLHSLWKGFSHYHLSFLNFRGRIKEIYFNWTC